MNLEICVHFVSFTAYMVWIRPCAYNFSSNELINKVSDLDDVMGWLCLKKIIFINNNSCPNFLTFQLIGAFTEAFIPKEER